MASRPLDMAGISLSSYQSCDKTSALIDESRVNVTLAPDPTRNRLRPPG